MTPANRLKRLQFRSQHRGIREADMLIGSFFDARSASWTEADMEWFEVLLEEQDVDIIAWATSASAPPAQFEGPMMDSMRRLDYLNPAA